MANENQDQNKDQNKDQNLISSKNIDLILACLKKEAFESAIRMIVECGIKNVYIYQTEYSQPLQINEKRIESIVHSSMEQSNNLFCPKITFIKNLDEINWNLYDKRFIFHLQKPGENFKNISSKSQMSMIYAIGPEGGFSHNDLTDFTQNYSFESLTLDVPILRAQTAVATCYGYLLNLSSSIH